MKRLSKQELQEVLFERYGDVKFDVAVQKLQQEGYVTVTGRGGRRKSYEVCTSVLK